MKRINYFYCLQHTKKEQGVFIEVLGAGGETQESPACAPTVATGGFLGYF
jgi:hypothetical protein